mgnify:CR=1 FL=1
MQWIEVSVPTRSDEIDDVCAQLAELGAGGMVVEDETDFQQFLEQNHQYWDYVGVCPCDTHLFMSVLACLHNFINSNTLMTTSQFNLTCRAQVCSARGGRTSQRSSARCRRQK